MQRGLRSAQHAGVQMRRRTVLVDAGDLLDEKGGVPHVIVHPGEPQKYQRDVATALT